MWQAEKSLAQGLRLLVPLPHYLLARPQMATLVPMHRRQPLNLARARFILGFCDASIRGKTCLRT